MSAGSSSRFRWTVLVAWSIATVVAVFLASWAVERTALGQALGEFLFVIRGWTASAAVLAIAIVEVLRHVRRLEAVEAELRAVTDSAGDAIVSADERGRIVYFNPAAERMFGRTKEDVSGERLTILMPERFREAHERGLERHLRGGEPRVIGKTVELAGVRADGTEFALELSLAASPPGGEVRFTGVLRDVTARQETMRELERAREAAEEAFRLKADFLATMSHEIRTPLNGVIGMTGLLLDTRLSPEQAEYANTIRQAGETLLELVNDILDFSKIEAGRLRIEPISFDLLRTVEETLAFFGGRAEEKSLDLLLRWVPETPRRVVGDPGRIRQILTNLVGNAVKFTGTGHVLVEIRADDSGPGERRTFRFSVEDTGIGIVPEALGRIFERFSQADPSTTRRFGGTGLGLAISKQLSELMGGAIEVRSTPGAGTTFSFHLPLTVDSEGVPLPDAAPGALSEVRLLIVDDNAVNRRILEEQIRSWGLRTDTASSGSEALGRLREAREAGDPFHLALLDHQMPELSGEDVGTLVKEDPDLRDTVLVLLTSAGVRGDANRMKEIGFAGYLTKPIQPSVLMDGLATAWAAREIPEATLVTRHSLAERTGASPRHRRLGLRILLVEDNPVNQRVGRMILEKLGCRVDTAADGREAVAMWGAGRYDVILMDCQMPEMDGFEATREIRRAEPEGARIPILAMTAAATDADRRECLEAGMDDHLAKPIRSEVVASALARWSGGREAPVEDPQSRSLEPDLEANLRAFEEEGGRKFVVDLVASFLRRSTEQIGALRAAVEADDSDRVRALAHDLKGSSATLGALEFARVCREIEREAEIHSVAEALDLVQSLEGHRERLGEALVSYRAE